MNVHKGRYFEKKVKEYLKKEGHEIIFGNFYTPYGEIDIISIYQNKIRFIEVKYLSKVTKIFPILKIDLSKVRRIFFSISYLKKYCRIKNYQVDAVSVFYKDHELNFRYLEDLRMS
jgi:Holliday junction resolvase-like predicted endonuclease